MEVRKTECWVGGAMVSRLRSKQWKREQPGSRLERSP